MATYTASTSRSGHVRAGKLTWKRAAKIYIRNAGAEKAGFQKFLVALRAIGVFGAPVALLDEPLFWVPGLNFITIGDNLLLWALIPASVFSLIRISAIRRQGGL